MIVQYDTIVTNYCITAEPAVRLLACALTAPMTPTFLPAFGFPSDLTPLVRHISPRDTSFQGGSMNVKVQTVEYYIPVPGHNAAPNHN